MLTPSSWPGCPFCGETTAGVFVSPRERIFYCAEHKLLWKRDGPCGDEWTHQNETIWKQNRERLRGFSWLEISWPCPWTDRKERC